MNRMIVRREAPREGVFDDVVAGAAVVSDVSVLATRQPEQELVSVEGDAGLEIPLERAAGSITSITPNTMPSARCTAVFFV